MSDEEVMSLDGSAVVQQPFINIPTMEPPLGIEKQLIPSKKPKEEKKEKKMLPFVIACVILAIILILLQFITI